MGFQISPSCSSQKVSSKIIPKFKKSLSMDVDVPKGHFTVFVGDHEKKRFGVPVSLLSKPSFQNLLVQVEDKYGFDHPMDGLSIPCTQDVFVDLISSFNS